MTADPRDRVPNAVVYIGTSVALTILIEIVFLWYSIREISRRAVQ